MRDYLHPYVQTLWSNWHHIQLHKTSNHTTRVKAQHRQVASPATQPETARSRKVGSTTESAWPTPCRVEFQARPALMKTDPAGWCISASAWRHSRKMEEKNMSLCYRPDETSILSVGFVSFRVLSYRSMLNKLTQQPDGRTWQLVIVSYMYRR